MSDFFKTDILRKEFQDFIEDILPKFWNVVCLKNIHATGIKDF